MLLFILGQNYSPGRMTRFIEAVIENVVQKFRNRGDTQMFIITMVHKSEDLRVARSLIALCIYYRTVLVAIAILQ